MRYLAVLGVGVFLILLCVFCAIQCYIRPVPDITGIETFRVRIDTAFRNAWIHQGAFAQGLYRTVFRNGDKIVFFPPRVRIDYDANNGKQRYATFGMVTAWDTGQKLLTLSSYAGGMLYVRFDPDAYGQKAILPVLDEHGTIDMSKAITIVTKSSVPNEDTLFCEGDVISIKTTTWQEVFSTTPAHPVIPKELVLSFRLCQSKP